MSPHSAQLDRPATSLPSRLSTTLRRCPTIGPWTLGAALGAGRTSTVYAARPSVLDDDAPWDYAIKVLHEGRSESPPDIQRFCTEAAVARQLSHPHLIAVLGGSLTESPRYIVLPRLIGFTLAAMIEQHQRLTIPHALWITRQVAEALSALHHAGWIHGDVQPSNIFISPEGHATLFDLGCASRMGTQDGHAEKFVTGALHYVAPEQFTSRHHTTAASDVYSLGVTLFLMLTGRMPYRGDRPEHIVEAHLHEVPPSIRSSLPEATRELSLCVASMLAKDPLRRPSATGELQSQLARLEIAALSTSGG